MSSHKSRRPKGFTIATLSKGELEKAVKKSMNFNQVIINLQIADSEMARFKLKQRVAECAIDISHFRSSRARASEAAILERRRVKIKKNREKEKLQRRDLTHRAKFILQDAKKMDRKHGFTEFDLVLEFTKEMIKNPCKYCGETKLMMTLDRIDNAKAHLKENVNPSCIRCNIFRRDMPYEAWLEIVPYLQEAYLEGLFENWVGGSIQKVDM